MKKIISILILFSFFIACNEHEPNDIIESIDKKINDKEYTTALSDIKKYTKKVSDTKYLSILYFQEAKINFLNERYSDCLNSILKSLENDSDNYLSILLRAETKIKLGDLNGAIEDCNKAKFINKEDFLIYRTKAVAYDFLNDKSNAISSYQYAIQKGDNDKDTYYNLGYIFLKNGNTIEACKHLSTAGELGKMEAFELIKSNCTFNLAETENNKNLFFEKKYSVRFPNDWIVDYTENSDKSLHTLVGNNEKCMVTIIEMNISSMFPDYNSNVITDFKKEDLLHEYFSKYNDFKFIEDKIINIDNNKAYKFKISFSFYSNKYKKVLNVFEEQYYTINPNTKNILIISVGNETEKELNNCSTELEKIIESIKIL